MVDLREVQNFLDFLQFFGENLAKLYVGAPPTGIPGSAPTYAN